MSVPFMPDEKKRQLPTDHLKEILQKLSDVMVEAERLRKEISRQLAEQRAALQPRVTPIRRKRATSKR